MSLSRAVRGVKKAGKLLITPKVEAFLREFPDGARFDEGTYWLIHEITQAWKANDRRDGRFGASSRGKCKRRQIFGYLGMPSPTLLDPDVQNLFNDGKWRHMRWQIMGVESGALTHVEHPYYSKKWRVSGRMDGLNSYDSFGFELKGDRQMSRILDEGTPDDHNKQIHTMMLATGWDTFAYVMEDKGSQTWREIVIKRDPKIMAEVKKELEELNNHVEYRKLPDILPACRSKEGPYRQCPFAEQCLRRESAFGDHWPASADWES